MSDRFLRLRFRRRRRCSHILSVFSRLLSLSLSLFFSLLSSLFKNERSGSNRSHAHLPLARFGLVFCLFPFCSLCRGFCFWSRPFRCASFLFLRFVRGAVFVPVRFWDSLGTRALECTWASDPLSWTLGSRVFGFSPSCAVFVFPCVWCLRLHTFSRWTGGDLTDPAGDLAHPLGGVTPGGNPILGAGLDTGICQRLFLVAGVWLGRQELRAVSAHRRSFYLRLSSLSARRCLRQQRFFLFTPHGCPQVFVVCVRRLVFFFALSLCLSLSLFLSS